MRPIVLFFALFALMLAGLLMCTPGSAADATLTFTLDAAPTVAAVEVPAPAACPGGQCANCPIRQASAVKSSCAYPGNCRTHGTYRSGVIVRGQPVRNIGRVIVGARPIRRVGAAIFRARPLARIVRGIGVVLGR